MSYNGAGWLVVVVQSHIVTNKQLMEGVAPKGSYHSYCRSNLTAQLQQTHRVRSVRHSRPKAPPVEQFQDFESYLRHLQHKEKEQAQVRPKTTDYRSAVTSRPATRAALARQSQCQDPPDLIKPYFPFFKCRIESHARTEKLESQFRLRNQKFKLNYRIIEENMGRGERGESRERERHQFFEL